MADSNELASEIASLREMLEARLNDDPVREAAFARLHEELASYKQNFLVEAERPLLVDLLLLFDSMQWFRTRLEAANVPASEMDSYQYLIDELLEALFRRDILPMEPLERFNPATQRAVQVQPAPTKADDGKVEKVVKRGFTRGNRVLRPEEVVVYRWTEADKR